MSKTQTLNVVLKYNYGNIHKVSVTGIKKEVWPRTPCRARRNQQSNSAAHPRGCGVKEKVNQ